MIVKPVLVPYSRFRFQRPLILFEQLFHRVLQLIGQNVSALEIFWLQKVIHLGS